MNSFHSVLHLHDTHSCTNAYTFTICVVCKRFHSTAPDRVKTTTQAYSEKEMHWAEPLELKTRASVEDILRCASQPVYVNGHNCPDPSADPTKAYQLPQLPLLIHQFLASAAATIQSKCSSPSFHHHIINITRYPIVLCVRNVASDKNRLHRMGEAMIDIRVLAELHADPHKTLKMPICGSARVEVLQRGTPRGFVEFDYTINKKEK